MGPASEGLCWALRGIHTPALVSEFPQVPRKPGGVGGQSTGQRAAHGAGRQGPHEALGGPPRSLALLSDPLPLSGRLLTRGGRSRQHSSMQPQGEPSCPVCLGASADLWPAAPDPLEGGQEACGMPSPPAHATRLPRRPRPHAHCLSRLEEKVWVQVERKAGRAASQSQTPEKSVHHGCQT